MHKELVDKRRWIDEERFLHALNYCMLLPGPEAQQLATYIGWLMHRTRGGLVAGLLFVLPGFVSILALSTLYALFREVTLVSSVFFGLKAAVLAVVVEAVSRVGKRALKSRLAYLVAGSAFIAIFFFAMPFPLIVLAAALVGVSAQAFLPSWLPKLASNQAGSERHSVVSGMEERGELAHTLPLCGRALRILAVWLLAWWLPVLALFLLLGGQHIFVQQALLFSQTAVVTFGGAYAVLAYIAQRAIEPYHWLLPGEMLDGLGLAETTPGPLIMVVQFVGFMGAYRHPGALSPLVAGIVGSVVTVWVTFVPCFLFIFVGAPYIEALRGNRRLTAALSMITAAVVGVILNLSLWFGLHVIFREQHMLALGPVHLLMPVPASVDVAALALSAFALVALFVLKWSLVRMLAFSAVAGVLLKLAPGLLFGV